MKEKTGAQLISETVAFQKVGLPPQGADELFREEYEKKIAANVITVDIPKKK